MELFNKIIAFTGKIENTIKASAISGMVWICVAALLGLIAQLQLFVKLPLDLGYGIIRPAFTAALIFGGLLSLFQAAVFYILQKMNDDSFQFPQIAFASFKFQQLAVLIGLISILTGYNKGREYGEFIFIADHLMLLCLLLGLIVAVINIRASKSFNIESAYIVATIAGMFVIYLLGNIGLPYSPYASVSLYTGIQDQALQDIYRLGLLSFFIVMPAITMLVVFIPEYYEVKLYSESMGRFHIVASTLILPLAGAGWLAGTVAPPLLQTIGIFSYLAFFIAVFAGILNIHYTITKSGKEFKSDVLGKLLRAGGALLMIYALVRILFSISFLRELVDYTFLNTRDLSQDALSYTVLILFAVSFYYFQKLNDHTFGEGVLKLLLFVGASGMVLMLASNVMQGIIQGCASLELTDKGELAQTSWANLMSAGSVMSVDNIQTGAEYMQAYLGSLRGLYLVGYVMVFITIITASLVFILNVMKNGNDGYKKPSLHI